MGNCFLTHYSCLHVGKIEVAFLYKLPELFSMKHQGLTLGRKKNGVFWEKPQILHFGKKVWDNILDMLFAYFIKMFEQY
jgi:hypothetical protein